MADQYTTVAANDRYLKYLGAYTDAVDLTNGSDTDLATVCRGFRVGTQAGAVKVTTLDGTTLTIPGVQLGEDVRLRCTRIWATGTSAQGITAFL